MFIIINPATSTTHTLNLHALRSLRYDKRVYISPEFKPTEDEFIETHLTFLDKTSYIEWTLQWKSLYNELSKKLRSLKKDRAANMFDISKLKIQAYYMLKIRTAGKLKSYKLCKKSKLQ